MKRSLLFILACLAIVLTLGACSDKEDNAADKKTIKLGTSPGPYSKLFLDAVKPILEKDGYKIEQVEFSELIQADIALTEGSIDLNVDQHTAYMENFNKEKKADLASITHIPTVPAGIFPGRKASLDEIKEGDVIAIPQDPSNAARAYALLQKADLIKLKDGVELVKATKNDIVENPHKLDIKEMDSAQIPRSLKDIDYGVIPGSIVYSSKLDASTSLLSEDVLKDLELVAVVDAKNKDAKWAKAVKNAYHSDAFKKYMDEHNKDDYWFIPEELR